MPTFLEVMLFLYASNAVIKVVRLANNRYPFTMTFKPSHDVISLLISLWLCFWIWDLM